MHPLLPWVQHPHTLHNTQLADARGVNYMHQIAAVKSGTATYTHCKTYN